MVLAPDGAAPGAVSMAATPMDDKYRGKHVLVTGEKAGWLWNGSAGLPAVA